MPVSLAALAAGFVFGAGLAVADMTNPAKVQNFLDLFGSWDPSLAFVMGGALATTAVGYPWVRRRGTPWLAAGFALPTRRDIDARLLVGSTLFGVGWGLGGLCPGPALAGLLQGVGEIYLFVASMLVGAGIHHWTTARARSRERA